MYALFLVECEFKIVVKLPLPPGRPCPRASGQCSNEPTSKSYLCVVRLHSQNNAMKSNNHSHHQK